MLLTACKRDHSTEFMPCADAVGYAWPPSSHVRSAVLGTPCLVASCPWHQLVDALFRHSIIVCCVSHFVKTGFPSKVQRASWWSFLLASLVFVMLLRIGRQPGWEAEVNPPSGHVWSYHPFPSVRDGFNVNT